MIDANKQYKTRDGRAVRLYATDGGVTEFPVHGAVWVGGGWQVHVWRSDGRWSSEGSPCDCDLVEVTLADELTEQIPWERLIPEIEWVAWDPAIRGFKGFTEKPVQQFPTDGTSYTWGHLGEEWPLDALITPAVRPCDWRETLCRRPEDR